MPLLIIGSSASISDSFFEINMSRDLVLGPAPSGFTITGSGGLVPTTWAFNLTSSVIVQTSLPLVGDEALAFPGGNHGIAAFDDFGLIAAVTWPLF